MFFLYNLLLKAAALVLFPRFLLDVVRRGKYAAGFRQRLGRIPVLEPDGRPVLWLHCVSVGETNAALPLVREIRKNFPEYRLVVSTTTKTGQNLARKIFADLAEQIFYFPYDFRSSVRRALERIQPSAVLIMETEIWFNFLREAHKSGARIAIVNGRLSEKSLRRYLYIKDFMQRILHYVDLALMQGYADAMRLRQIGIRATKTKVTGNLKFDQVSEADESTLTESFRRRFGIVNTDRPLIVAASTHRPEEKWLLAALKKIHTAGELAQRPRLLIAPRHPERFGEVEREIERAGFSWAKRSADPSAGDGRAEVILLDSIGELRAVYPLAEIVFVGGSLIPHGGQSILEPALAKKPIVTGFFTMNFTAIMGEFLEPHAVVQLPRLGRAETPAKLARVFTNLLKNDELRRKLAINARAVMIRNRGATQKTIGYLKQFLKGVE